METTALNFAGKALSRIEHLNSIEEILSFDEFKLVTHIAGLFDKEKKSSDGILFVKSFIYAKAKNTKKKDVILPALKEFVLNASVKAESEQMNMLDKAEMLMTKLVELSSLVNADPALMQIINMLAGMNTSSLTGASLN